ncbi:hypothetical protein FOCG_09109 [Fusarium oxysporum f. sp. radicis-lycopersici 26381]|uniref:Uncharacterized protein n=1 Tax=Fusarium oxysporum Fo47 TaxID=660027 RepID=W9K532_FUSOX|nr:hypothetical protein FOZG_08518 [Fusarium oxysporum Fo47]EWZ83619.1 hypothetical protein FOWG_12592 [Fusarium oxysporum f. sp. lycopersici MN25]EXL50975.1 hypothetical protein FOCG_09109 [Fusarium oxysporum f. sp. radicis-lycopersici 26381]
MGWRPKELERPFKGQRSSTCGGRALGQQLENLEST